jgi:hypothetical protein
VVKHVDSAEGRIVVAAVLAAAADAARTRNRTNKNPNDTEANAAGRRGLRVCSANGTCENQKAWLAKSLTKSEALVMVRTLEMHRGRRVLVAHHLPKPGIYLATALALLILTRLVLLLALRGTRLAPRFALRLTRLGTRLALLLALRGTRLAP